MSDVRDIAWLQLDPGTRPLGSRHLLRRRVELPSLPDRVHVRVTAASVYRLFINGSLVMVGPARGTERYLFADHIDVIPYLREGINIIAVEVAHYSNNVPKVLQHEFPMVSPGISFLLAVGDGEEIGIDSRWRMHRLECFEADAPWARGQKSEYVYASRYPTSWTAEDFDDTDWTAPMEMTHAPTSVRPRPTALPAITERVPSRLTDAGFYRFPPYYRENPIPARLLDWFGGRRDSMKRAIREPCVCKPEELDHVQYRRVCDAVSGGTLCSNATDLLRDGELILRAESDAGGYAVYDFGSCIPAYTHVTATIPAGARLDVCMMEWLDPETGAPIDSKHRAGCVMVGFSGFTIIGDGGEISFSSLQQHNFRYVSVIARGLNEGESIVVHGLKAVEVSALAESDVRADVICSDPLLNRIVEATKHTIRLTSHDFFASGGTPERIITAGDCLQAAEAGRIFFGQLGAALSRATLDLFIDQEIGTGAAWPNMPRGRCSGSTSNDGEDMLWMLAPCMLMLEMIDLARTGGRRLPERDREVALGIADDVRSHLTAEGLIEANQQQSNWSDWSRMAVGTRKTPYTGVSTSVNAYYYRMFRELAELEPNHELFRELADSIGSALRRLAVPYLEAPETRVNRFVPDLFLRAEDRLVPYESPAANVFGGCTVVVSETTQYWLLWSGALTAAQEGRLWDVLRGWRAFELPRRDNTRMLNPARASSVMGLCPRFKYMEEHRDPVLYRDARDAFGHNVLAEDSLWESLELDARAGDHPTTPFVGKVLYQALTGISPTEKPATYWIAPIIDDSLEWARGYKETKEGIIGVSWRRGEGYLILRVGLPRLTRARIRLPEFVIGQLHVAGHDVPSGGVIEITRSVEVRAGGGTGLQIVEIG